MSRAVGAQKPQEAQKAKVLWTTNAAKDRKEEFYDPAREEDISKRNKTRLELWEVHLKDPIAALDKALQCIESPYWSWLEALWKQGSNDQRSGGVRSDATVVGRSPVAFSGCLGQCASTHNLRAVESPKETRAVRRALSCWRKSWWSSGGWFGWGPASGRMASFSSFWCRRSLCARQRGLQLLHRVWLSSPRVEGRKWGFARRARREREQWCVIRHWIAWIWWQHLSLPPRLGGGKGSLELPYSSGHAVPRIMRSGKELGFWTSLSVERQVLVSWAGLSEPFNLVSGKGGTCFICRNLRLRAFRRVEIVLSKSVLRFFKPWTV